MAVIAYLLMCRVTGRNHTCYGKKQKYLFHIDYLLINKV
jgi:hypothetical protein